MKLLPRALLVVSALAALVTGCAVLSAWSQVRDLSQSDELVARAQKLGAAGRPDEALKAVLAAIAAAPDNPRARRELAMHMVAQGKAEAAAAELRAAIAAAPRDTGLRLELGVVLRAVGDGEGAISMLRDAAAMDPDNGLVLAVLSGCLLDAGATIEGASVGEKAVALAPRLQSAWFNLGLGRWHSGDREGALDALREAARLRPSHFQSLVCAAAVARELGRSDQSVDLARQAVNVAPEEENAWIASGEALLHRGDRTGARTAAARAVELQPASAAARLLLSRMAATDDAPLAPGPMESP